MELERMPYKPLKTMGFKPPLELAFAIEQAGESAGITNAATIKQLVERGLQDLHDGLFELRPMPFLRIDGKKVSKHMAERKEKRRQESINVEHGKNAADSENPRERSP